MGNKQSEFADFDVVGCPNSPSGGVQQTPRLSKNKSLSALTALAKTRFSSMKSPSSSAIGNRHNNNNRRQPSSAKLERTSRFSRSVTSGAINGHLVGAVSSKPVASVADNILQKHQQITVNTTSNTTSGCLSLTESANDEFSPSLGPSQASSSSSTCSDHDALSLSKAILDSEYFVGAHCRRIKRLADRPHRGPAMGTHAKPTTTTTNAVNARPAVVAHSSSSALLQISTPHSLSTTIEYESQRAPLANLEATLTSCSSDDSFALLESSTGSGAAAALKTAAAQGSATSAVTLREQHSSRSLPWSVTNSSSEIQLAPKSSLHLVQSSSPADMAKLTSFSSSQHQQSQQQSQQTSSSFGKTSSSTSGNSSPASSIVTSAPDFGAAVLERMLASLATTPSVEQAPSLPCNSSDDDEEVALQPIKIGNAAIRSNNQRPKQQQQEPWDTFYTTCPWSYDLNSSTISAPLQQQQQQPEQRPPSQQQQETSSASATLVRRNSSDSASSLSSTSEVTPQALPPAITVQQQSTLTVNVHTSNPRENSNRNSCGADSGLGGMDLAAFSQISSESALPALPEQQQQSRHEEDPSTPLLLPHVPVHARSLVANKSVPVSSRMSQQQQVTGGSSTSSERCDFDDIVSCTNDSEVGLPGHCGGSVSESLMTHADDVTMVEHGATTKRTGWLNVKNYMVRRRDRLELATRRRWTRYWTCLKSSVLLLYSPPDSNSNEQQQSGSTAVNAKHFIVIEEVLCQPLPEHPKRDNCFSLSTTSGDVFLLQADSLVERDAWISSIHAACAMALTSQPTIPSAMRVLRTEVGRLDQAVMHQRRALESKQQADGTAQSMQVAITEWESLILTSFVLRTYLASLQMAELPNPKTLLAQVSSQTKAVLRKLGAFTVSALHAIVSARGLMRSEDIAVIATPSIAATPSQQPNEQAAQPAQPPATCRSTLLHTPDSLEINALLGNVVVVGANSTAMSSSTSGGLSLLRIPVRLPNGSSVVFEWPPAHGLHFPSMNTLAPVTPTPKSAPGTGVTHTKAGHVLKHLCTSLTSPPLSSPDHFLMARFKGEEEMRIVDRNEVLLLNVIDMLVVEPRSVVRIDMARSSLSEQFGVEVESELDADGCEQPADELMRVFVSRVDADARAAASGVQVGDEILVINNRLVANLDMATIESFFEQCLNVRLTLRVARRRSALESSSSMLASSSSKQQHRVPSPDSGSADDLPASGQQQVYDQQHQKPTTVADSNRNSDTMKNKEQDVPTVQRPVIRKPSLTDTQKLYRAFRELIETEYAYIRDLRHLLEVYLAPLRDGVFTSDDNFGALYDAAADVYAFQCQFASSLDDAFHLLPSFRGHHQAADLLLQPSDFRKPLSTLSAAFRCYAAKFKLYSSFSVRHSKCLQILQEYGPTNRDYQQLVASANPSNQHSATLESYLIKPIQRILRYPLILEQLRQLSAASFGAENAAVSQNNGEQQPAGDPSRQLGEASRIMAMVAEHVNELQKIFDEFGNLFDNVVTEYRQAFPSVPLAFSSSTTSSTSRAELNIADLEMYGHVEWLEHPTKARKGREIYSICFVFTEALVIVCKERSRKAKAKPFGKVVDAKSGSPPDAADDEVIHYQRLLPLVDVTLRIPSPPEAFTNNADPQKHPFWQVVYRIPTSRVSSPSGDFDPSASEIVFTFANSSYDNKQEFVTTISTLIRQLRMSDQRKQPVSSRRQQQQSAHQRSRSAGRLQHANRLQYADVHDAYDLQPLQMAPHHQRGAAPPLPPRHHAQVLPPRGDGSTSSGGNSDSLNSSIASINGAIVRPSSNINNNGQQNGRACNNQSSAKLMFVSPAGSSMSSSGSQQQQQQQQQQPPVNGRCQSISRSNLDPQSSPVWKPRGLPAGGDSGSFYSQQQQQQIKTAVINKTSAVVSTGRSKSPGAAERLYWHDSDVVLYRNGTEVHQQRNAVIIQQQQQQQPSQYRALRPTLQQSSFDSSAVKPNPHLAAHQQHQHNASHVSRRNGWFSDCECNTLLGGFDTSNVV